MQLVNVTACDDKRRYKSDDRARRRISNDATLEQLGNEWRSILRKHNALHAAAATDLSDKLR